MFPSTGPAPVPSPARALSAEEAPRILRYPTDSLLLVGGIPGAGKSTLLNRLFALEGTETMPVATPGGARVIDSQQARNRLARRLRALPYPVWRWATHLLHYLRVLRALRKGGGPVAVHVTATHRAVLGLLGRYCRHRGREVNLLLIDVDPRAALEAQIRRGRALTPRTHRRHVRRWNRVLLDCARGPGAVVPAARSLLLLDRSAAAELAEIRFAPAAAEPGDGGAAPRAVP
ncbi:AAA family ATPase [Streptomonospora wellingtoniae]|uniref:AAA family ATPase n=1 Tax=Streptomonospora wellingtoniae TaxID=3075544 RepID=A0ABU2KNY4_9ACTN|nr:AAA family ATPase [Streptomonospora sp. DSM 45055]MDT0300985.1 AAA family ATPase [Streptomonospora sp. DSM 45055]